MAANVTPVSFKNNRLEINMYNFIKSKSSPSTYYKELIMKDKEFIDYIINVDKKYAIEHGFIKHNINEDTIKEFDTSHKEPSNKISNLSSLLK